MESVKAKKAMHPNVTREHAALHDFVGDWNLAQTIWPGPGAKPQKHHGKSSCVPVLDGLATMMTTVVEETNFKGTALMTYSQRNRRYELAWIDTEGDAGVLRMNGWSSRADSSKAVRSAFGTSSAEARVWSTSLQSAAACLPDDVLTTIAEFSGPSQASLTGAGAAEGGPAMRLVENKVSNDKWVLEFFVAGPDGAEFMVQQNVFTRAT